MRVADRRPRQPSWSRPSRSWVRRDLGRVLLLALLLAPLGGAGGGWAGVGLSTLTALPLVVRRRLPVPAFAGVLLLAGSTIAVLPGRHPAPVVLVLAAVAAVALHRRGRAVVVAVLAAAAVLVAVARDIAGTPRGFDGQPVPLWAALLMLGALLSAAVLLGSVLRVRRAYLAQLEERAARLEVERDQRTAIAVAAERARIAREMHDVVAHSVTVMVTLAEGVAARAERSPERTVDPATLRAVSETGRQALGELRRLLGLLGADEAAGSDDGPGGAAGSGGTPQHRAPQPGVDDVGALVEQVRAAGLQVALTQQGPLTGWSPGAGLAVYRIVQEGLTNTLKHAGPSASARVLLRAGSGRVEVEVEDDGAGRLTGSLLGGLLASSGSGADGSGRGLAGMAERAASWGGEVSAGPVPSGGWRVRAVLDTGACPQADGRAPR